MPDQRTPKRHPNARLRRAPIFHADCIEIPLTRGKSTFVDLDCPPEILACNWSASGHGYAVSSVGPRREQRRLRLHREILGLSPDDKQEVDHVDRDPGNNRRTNLRLCTAQQNQANRSTNRGGTSRFRGVSWCEHANKWRAVLSGRVDGKKITKHVGYFDDEVEAARAWDATAIASGLYDLAFLRLNFP